MKKELGEMFLSNNEEDIRLALEIARRIKVSVKEVNEMFNQTFSRTDIPIIHTVIYNDFLCKGFVKGSAYQWDYVKWKEEEVK